ncbi:MAG TPA: AAA family ATPase [Candidatus Saccharimonadales bacterium]|nr:AAA family ATPase [Candidatus Saccharimonadales bacterium]
MSKQVLVKPVIFLLYGFPGSGKTFFSRQFADEIKAAVVSDEQLRSQFYESPDYSSEQDKSVEHLLNYMSEQFLKVGSSVILDANSSSQAKRRQYRELAAHSKAGVQLIWLQLDVESSFNRVVNRDRRTADDKYAVQLDRTSFEDYISKMQNPTPTEEYIVISGKHAFSTQKNAVVKKLFERGLLNIENASDRMVKPGLINRVPNLNSGRVFQARRNIIIR